VRASAGTLAVVRGRRPDARPGGDALPTTAYLLVGERCSRDCGFCPQARRARARGDLLARVNWPKADGERFWTGLARAVSDGQIRRVCLQLTVAPGVLEEARAAVSEVRRRLPGVPVCVSAACRSLAEVERILGWGADRVTLAVDAASPAAYRMVKGGSLERRLDFIARAARRFPGRIGTHLIAGLGETEEEMVGLMQVMTDLDVTVALFAFTPVEGTGLEDREPPDLRSYRRLQAARHLVVRGLVRAEEMAFDAQGRIRSYGLPWERVRQALAGGQAFQTSGCPDCNRPYYNERPSGDLFNYPRPLSEEEKAAALEEARPVACLTTRTAGPRGRGRGEWRLIVEDEPRCAAENMAVDEAVARSVAAGSAPPTLRFYRWRPPAVSLGYFQDPAEAVDLEACRTEGVSVVRRLTGGRAVLHDREVTYSVVVPSDVLPDSVVESYRLLAEGLVTGLRALGYRAYLAPERPKRAGDPGPGVPGAACFEVPSSYEILVGGRKVVGSAQVRRAGVVLQHGSIMLELDAARLARVLGLGPEGAERLRARAAGLAEFAASGGRGHGAGLGYEEVCRAVAEGLEAVLGVRFLRSGLGADEEALARRLAEEKYGQDAWNLGKPRKDKEDDGCTISW